MNWLNYLQQYWLSSLHSRAGRSSKVTSNSIHQPTKETKMNAPTPAEIQAAFAKFNSVVTEVENIESMLAVFLPANVTTAFTVLKAFQPVLTEIEGDLISIVTKIEAAMPQTDA